MRILNESIIAGSARPPQAAKRQKPSSNELKRPAEDEEIFFN
jgi:hypothetical protein